MAQNLADAQGIVADSNYPTGYKIVDGQTVINSHINQDIIQFFQKMMDYASITPNGSDDNEVNNYQFLDALVAYIRGNVTADSNNKGVLEVATTQEAKEMGITNNVIVTQSLGEVLSDLVTKVIDINEWNMDSDDTKQIAHTLSATEWKTIRSINVIIINDTSTDLTPLNGVGTSGTVYGGVGAIDSTNITLYRTGLGKFDTANYQDDTSFNRGWITIQYKVDAV